MAAVPASISIGPPSPSTTRLNSNVLYKYFKKQNIHADFLLSTNEEVISKLDFKVKEYQINKFTSYSLNTSTYPKE